MAFGRVMDHLGGDYIAAEDVGHRRLISNYSQDDALLVALQMSRRRQDPSRYTAWGVYRGLQAIASVLWGSRSLKNRSVAIQGLGSVGSNWRTCYFGRERN